MCAMHLEKAFLSTTNYGGKGRKPANTASLREATAKHEAWLKKQGLHPEQRELKRAFTGKAKIELPDYKVESKYQLSNGIGNGFKQGVLANLHKESKEVQQQILDKASRCMPLFNKGGYQYATDDTDMTTVGSKSRRG
jgi:hypothetical protein